jgi:hypothetical protein
MMMMIMMMLVIPQQTNVQYKSGRRLSVRQDNKPTPSHDLHHLGRLSQQIRNEHDSAVVTRYAVLRSATLPSS